MTAERETLFPKRDLEEENKAIRAEIECLRKVLASNGLTSASALTCPHNSDLPRVPKQPENRQERIDMKCVTDVQFLLALTF
jgi:hypothetical protein